MGLSTATGLPGGGSSGRPRIGRGFRYWRNESVELQRPSSACSSAVTSVTTTYVIRKGGRFRIGCWMLIASFCEIAASDAPRGSPSTAAIQASHAKK